MKGGGKKRERKEREKKKKKEKKREHTHLQRRELVRDTLHVELGLATGVEALDRHAIPRDHVLGPLD